MPPIRHPSSPQEVPGIMPQGIKRSRQACDTCRRKKSRCTGEKPVCATCKRLKQECSYKESFMSSFPDRYKDIENAVMEEIGPRLDRIEDMMVQRVEYASGPGGEANSSSSARLDRIERMLQGLTSDRRSLVPNETSGVEDVLLQLGGGRRPSDRHVVELGYSPQLIELPPPEVMEEAANLYFIHCHNQPYSVFHEGTFKMKLAAGLIEPQVQYCVLGMAVRFSENPYFANRKTELVEKYLAAANQIITSLVREGVVTLALLQSIVLCVFVDIHQGRPHRAFISLGIAIRLAEACGLFAEPSDQLSPVEQEEHRRVFWAMYMLDRIAGTGLSLVQSIRDEDVEVQLPMDEESFAKGMRKVTGPLIPQDMEDDMDQPEDLGIVAYLVRILAIWGRVVNYCIQGKILSKSTQPWHPGSDFAHIEAQLLQFESNFPKQHRYTPETLRQRVLGDEARHYAAPWLIMQFIYHTAFCLLHHPIFPTMRLQHIWRKIPGAFFQRSSDMRLVHSRWIVRFIRDAEACGYEIMSPFIGYCVCVAATVFLQHCHSEDMKIRAEATGEYKTAMDFLRKASRLFPALLSAIELLQQLEQNVGLWQTLAKTNTVPPRTQDVSLLWDALDYIMMCNFSGESKRIDSCFQSKRSQLLKQDHSREPLVSPASSSNQRSDSYVIGMPDPFHQVFWDTEGFFGDLGEAIAANANAYDAMFSNAVTSEIETYQYG